MKIFYLVILVVAVLQLKTVCSSHSQLSRIDNLPSILVPRKYDLLIYTDFENEKLLFHGEVRITVSYILFRGLYYFVSTSPY